MATKKKVTKVVEELPKAYRGSFSTFMVTIIIIGLCFFLPMITANEVEKSRSGEGRYTPMEEMLWDFSETDDFKDVKYTATDDELGDSFGSNSGTFDEANQFHSVYWMYQGEKTVPSTENKNCIKAQAENIIDFEIADPVIAEYGSFALTDGLTESGNPYNHDTSFHANYQQEMLIFNIDQDSEDWIEKDATRFDIYIDFENTPTTDGAIFVQWVTGETGNTYELYEDDWTGGNILSIDITVEDLIQISSIRGSSEYIRILLTNDQYDEENEMYTGDLIIYDFQLYGLDSSTPSLTIISTWYIIQSVIIFLMGIVMMPQVSIGGLIEYLTNFTKSI